MGNEQSTGSGSRSDGVPFVCWQRKPTQPQSATSTDAPTSPRGGTASYHFAEPSSYRYDRVPRVVTGNVVFTNPPKADGELRNKPELLGNMAIVERGGRVHFPDIVRRLLAVGVTGIVFIERVDNKRAIQSLFDGFHSSGRQQVSIPIVLMSKYHADQLLVDKPARISIELLKHEQACKYVVPDDVYFGVQTAARAGDVELLRHLLEIDTSGSVVDNIPKAVTLCDAAENGHVDCIEILHSIGVSLDEQKRDGNTAEHLARMAGHTNIEDYLREQAESESVKDHRRKIEETVAKKNSTLQDLLKIAKYSQLSVDQLYREMIRDHKCSTWLEQPRIIYEVFHLLTVPVSSPESDPTEDPSYGRYTIQHFCCEVALWYSPKIFQKGYQPGGAGWTLESADAFDINVSSGYLKVLFNFLCTADPLDDVLLVLFCKVTNHLIVNQNLGKLIWCFLADEGKFIVPWVVCHIGLDSIRDTVVWLLYSDMSEAGQLNVQKSELFDCLFARLYSWQRTLGWGVGTAFQRDSVENICSLINYIIYPPAVYIMNHVATFVDNTDHTLPLITDQHFPLHHNELFKSLLIFLLNSTDVSFGTLIDLGFSEICRQCTQGCTSLVVREGGALSIVMMLMSTLGYHRKKRDLTGIEGLLKSAHVSILHALIPRVEKFVKLCRAVVTKDVNALRGLATSSNPGHIKAVNAKGSALLYIITFLKRCVFLQSGDVDYLLANFGLMPCLLACYGSHPSNSLLHHELTDVIRFVLMDPDQKRLPSSPLLNSLFIEGANILDFVIRAYDENVQYKGHMTTIANSIFTLTNTPNCKSDSVGLSCQDVVRQYTSQYEKWVKFEETLAEQNRVEMLPLGERNAPLCHGCLKLKQSAIEYVSATLGNAEVEEYTGYLETIFSGAASHYCKVTFTDEFITGFMYKKDKIHDHIPIPEPTRVSSFIQFPVPMPFHALTFTITFFGLCQICDKLWYCDTLQSPNWTTRMKWVIPTSVRKWYSFGVTEGPGSGAHGLQFSSKGYKSFIVLTDTWGRQEQWMHAIDASITSLANQMSCRGNTESAMAIEIDNEVDADEFDVMRMREITGGSNGVPSTGHPSTIVGSAPKSDSSSRSSRLSDEDETAVRPRSSTMSSIDSESEPIHKGSDDEDRGSDTLSPEASLAMPNVRSRSSTNIKFSGNGAASGSKRTSASGRNLDLKRFQPDTRKFSEILNNLKVRSPPSSFCN
ncbi:hypothetical protein PHYBOEH_005101 [Phytophthora boehmeriae]|uniref:Uncharacterized protein n=1 Tax=Phytophthora boehmeriae TaxID=109152 RepID=A0A8T1X8C8_9STRA|nr:hypothetical protein PHYBOEH_005101 [Phytophthora boehmeriae]